MLLQDGILTIGDQIYIVKYDKIETMRPTTVEKLPVDTVRP